MNIVLGYDDSEEARRALEKTTELAKALAADVIVTSVAPVLRGAGRSMGPVDPSDPPERHKALADDAAATLTERGVKASAVSGLGEPGEAIVGLADSRNAELIVLGMSHHHHLFGGVGEDVAHHAHCDVLLVH